MNERESTTVELTIPAKPEYLALSRLVLSGLSLAARIEPEVLADLKLAVTEACSSSIHHVCAAPGSGSLAIRYELDASRLAVEVRDGNGSHHERRTAAAGARGGDDVNIAVIRAIVDELEIGAGTNGGGARLSFTKYLL